MKPFLVNNWPARLPQEREQKEKCILENEELLRVKEVARSLRVDDTTVRRWIKTGVLEATVLPSAGNKKTYRVRKSVVDALLNTQDEQ